MTQYNQIGVFSDLVDISNSDYRTRIKGMITYKQFHIKHKAHLFDFEKHSAVINGFIKQNSKSIEVAVKVDDLKTIHLILFVMSGQFLTLLLLQLLLGLLFHDFWGIILIPFLLLFAKFGFLITILLLRKSTRKMYQYFNNLFVYLAQKNNVAS